MNIESATQEQLKAVLEILNQANEQLFGMCSAYVREDIIEKLRQSQQAQIEVILGGN